MRFSPSDLAMLAQMKAEANQQPEPGPYTSVINNPNDFDYTAVTETNGWDPGNIGQTLQTPTAPGSSTQSNNQQQQQMHAQNGLGFGPQGAGPRTPDSRGNFGAFGSEHDVNSNRDNPYGVRSVHDNATGFGFSGNPEHFRTSGNPANMQGLGIGYNNRNPSPFGEMDYYSPATRRASGMFNGLTGVTNTVRGINGQQTPPNPSAATSRASNMFNSLAGVTNAVRGINGQQPPQQQQTQPNNQQKQQMLAQNQQQESPNWGQNTNPTMTAGAPPGHGGGNPGFSGMMNNTADTMAALKALISNLSRR